jgi:hypothetical protein
MGRVSFAVCFLSLYFMPVACTDCTWNPRTRKRVCDEESSPGSARGALADGGEPMGPVSEACDVAASQQLEDLRTAALATRGGSDSPAVKTVHLVYVHLHGHVNHYYHFLHDALLTFFPLYTSFADEGGNPTIARVALWNQQSFGPFTPVFEAVYGVKVDEVPCKCDPGSCAEVSQTTTTPVS